jgi:hypothetical protein
MPSKIPVKPVDSWEHDGRPLASIRLKLVKSNVKCQECEEYKPIIVILVNQIHAVNHVERIFCDDCFEDFRWKNVTDYDEEDNEFMGA